MQDYNAEKTAERLQDPCGNCQLLITKYLGGANCLERFGVGSVKNVLLSKPRVPFVRDPNFEKPGVGSVVKGPNRA